ncbi:MAG: hypothetical protein CO189_00515 [candidate division Zixibacteria bacterium CG_4_9_14_3_um_filter_46_8]|nr:MAG: hypothetical protein CO189_00515 [candidate division Zixibacteria bacterium CG_4_9_14_3_um_filter_46_8]
MKFSNPQESLIFKITVCLLLCSTGLLFVGPNYAMPQLYASTLPAGTPITVRINQEVTSKTFLAGSKVNASVTNDVVVGGNVLIRAGALCDVSVLSSKKAGSVGSPGSITISVNSVQAVDGSNIPIMNAVFTAEGASKVTSSIVVTILCCILALLMKGKDGVIPIGTQISGYTVSQAEIRI